MSEPPQKNRFIPRGDTATLVSAFIVVSGIILTALSMPASELIIGAGIGFLLKTVVKSDSSPND